jgi:outer membrane protein assembly factor BamB
MTAAGDRIVAQGKDSVVALAAATGKVLWSVDVGQVTAPLLARDGWVLVAAGEQLSAVRLSDGAKVWDQKLGRIEQRPAIDGDRLYAPVADGRLVALDLTTGAVQWERQLIGAPTEPFALAERIYLGAGRNFVCIRARDGAVHWDWGTIGAPIVGAPAADANNVFMVAMDNLVRAMDRVNGNGRWKADLGHRPDAGPTVTGHTVAVPGRAAAIRGFDATTGKPAVSLKLPDQMVVQPTFFIGPDGRQMLAAVTANLKGENTLTVAGSVLPSLPLVPLTLLPGSEVKPGLPAKKAAGSGLRAPLAPPSRAATRLP